MPPAAAASPPAPAPIAASSRSWPSSQASPSPTGRRRLRRTLGSVDAPPRISIPTAPASAPVPWRKAICRGSRDRAARPPRRLARTAADDGRRGRGHLRGGAACRIEGSSPYSGSRPWRNQASAPSGDDREGREPDHDLHRPSPDRRRRRVGPSDRPSLARRPGARRDARRRVTVGITTGAVRPYPRREPRDDSRRLTARVSTEDVT